MSIGLRFLPLRRLQALAARLAARGRVFPAARRHSAERIAWAVRAAARYVPSGTCLPQALAAQFMLARQGHAARLRIGMARTEQGRVAGHAWVEGADGPVIGRTDGPYAVLEGMARRVP
jgi:hypothetical protein